MKSIEGMDANRLCISMNEAPNLLGISRRKLWELVNRKAIPHFRIGHKIMFSLAALRDWIDAQVIGGDE